MQLAGASVLRNVGYCPSGPVAAADARSVSRPWRPPMTSHREPSSGNGGPGPSVANLGLVRPPVVYLGSILLGLLLHFVWPLPLVRHAVGAPVGAGMVLLAIGLFI